MTHFFFIDGHRIDVQQDHLTGSAIKELGHKVDSNINVSDELVLEGTGHDKDRLIADDESVDLTLGHGNGLRLRHFSTRPRTTFGAC